jgi:protein-L-isoaspartate(D-aspartate) O-methyltransferase
VAAGQLGDSFGGFRARLVEQLRQQGIEDLAVLRAVGEVPRHRFVAEALQRQAYEDTSLPIGFGQTISQPSTQARSLQALALTGRERVLEVGTGSGYQTALLTYLADHVLSIERIPELARQARTTLEALGIRGVQVVVGDGSLGWRPLAPFDAIVVAAGGSGLPQPLIDQLAIGGRLVMPRDRDGRAVLVRVVRTEAGCDETELAGAQFVPLIGRHGRREDADA